MDGLHAGADWFHTAVMSLVLLPAMSTPDMTSCAECIIAAIDALMSMTPFDVIMWNLISPQTGLVESVVKGDIINLQR
jgi:hypothetical protein